MNKKNVVFASVVSSGSLLMMSIASCGESEDAVTNSTTGNDSGETIEDSTAMKIPPEVILPIVNTNQWKTFKGYWNLMTKIEAKVDSTDTWDLYHSYNNTLSDEAKSELGSQLDTAQTALSQLFNDGILSESIYKVLKSLTNERYKYLTEGYGYMFMTRMAPPPGAYDRIDLMEDMEARIDTLQDLKEKKMINEEMYNNGLKIIQQDVEKFALTNFEQGYYMFHTGVTTIEEKEDSSIFDKFYIEFQKNHVNRVEQMKKNGSDKKYIQEVEETYLKDMESLKKLESSLPTIKLLIQNLIE